MYAVGILPERNFRFALARISSVAREIADMHSARPRVAALMGESILGSFFLALHSHKEDDLTVSVQMECRGPVKRLISFASSYGAVRALPGKPDAEWSGDLYAGKGSGIMNVNRWRENNNKVYSSSVEMRDKGIDRNLEEFVARSEQIQGFVGLESSLSEEKLEQVSGYFFWAMPGATADDVDQILELTKGKDARPIVDELLGIDSGGGRLRTPGETAVESVKVLRTGSFYFQCKCDVKKIENMLFLLGRDEVNDILHTEGFVAVSCEFCKKRYEFNREQTTRLFQERDNPADPNQGS